MTNEEAIKIIDKGLDIGKQMHFLTVEQMNEAKQIAIKALSQQRNKWIPIKEVLPKPMESVLVYYKCYFECQLYEELFVPVSEFSGNKDDKQMIACGCKYGKCGECEKESEHPYFSEMRVDEINQYGEWCDSCGDAIPVAWMPLPEPYEEQEVDDDKITGN